jgi:putative peptidoglycan lipid II flippase
VWPLGHVGIALGTAISAWVNALALWWLLRKRGHFSLDDRARRLLPRLVLATLGMVAVLFGAMPLLAPLAARGFAMEAVALALLIGGGGLAYLAGARLLGLFTVKGLAAQVKRKKA